MKNANDVKVVRDLARQYAELANQPIQEERRKLWAAHLSLKKTRPLVLATFGMWNAWCREVFGDAMMKCTDPFYREIERRFRMQIFQQGVGDDWIIEPWFTWQARVKGDYRATWGVQEGHQAVVVEGGSWKYDPPLTSWADMAKLTALRHEVDEEGTREDLARVQEVLGDILPVDLCRQPVLNGFQADISTSLAGLRGLDQMMIDMYESPKELHALLAFMRDGILQNHQQAEDAGHLTLACHQNGYLCYADELEWPRPNSGPRKRRDLWGFCAAQEFTLVSPEFHDEFLLQYQLPIFRHFGLLHYGCCENLTRKIGILRQFPNLRSIAVTPTADVRQCAEQIGTDFAISWRPNPTDMVCAGWDERRIRRIIGDGLEACKEGFVHLHLKDVETVQGEPDRLARWVRIVRELSERYA